MVVVVREGVSPYAQIEMTDADVLHPSRRLLLYSSASKYYTSAAGGSETRPDEMFWYTERALWDVGWLMMSE